MLRKDSLKRSGEAKSCALGIVGSGVASSFGVVVIDQCKFSSINAAIYMVLHEMALQWLCILN